MLKKEYYENGNLMYEGEYIDDKRSQGKSYYENGKLMYDGDWLDGKWSGKGKMYRINGMMIYEGDWLDGKWSGKGKMYRINGMLMYEGDWLDDKMSGQGKMFNENGNIYYDGNLVDGKRSGQGKSYDDKGKLTYDGNWLDGIVSTDKVEQEMIRESVVLPKQEKPEQSIRAVRLDAEKGISNEWVWERLAKNHKNASLNEEAVNEYKNAIDLAPDNDLLYAELGSYLVASQKFDDAEFYIEKAIKINPENLKALGSYVQVLCNAKKFDLALQYAKKVLTGLEKSKDLKMDDKENILSDINNIRDTICAILLDKGKTLGYHDQENDSYYFINEPSIQQATESYMQALKYATGEVMEEECRKFRKEVIDHSLEKRFDWNTHGFALIIPGIFLLRGIFGTSFGSIVWAIILGAPIIWYFNFPNWKNSANMLKIRKIKSSFGLR